MNTQYAKKYIIISNTKKANKQKKAKQGRGQGVKKYE
jgi:hypothetical protein